MKQSGIVDSIVFFLLTTFLFASAPLFAQKALAQIKVNEFSSFSNNDWIEIINVDSESYDLSRLEFRDDSASNKLQLEGSLSPGEILAFDWSNKLNKAGDTVKIVEVSSGNIIDSIGYGNDALPAPSSDLETIGRKPDGSSTIVLLNSSSKGGSNNDIAQVNTPTPTPSNSPTPTKIPTLTKTPKPTSTPKQSSSTVSTTSLTPTSSFAPPKSAGIARTGISPVEKQSTLAGSLHPTAVLGVSSDEKDKDASPTPNIQVASASFFSPLLFVPAGGVFLLACGILVYLRKRRNELA